MTHPFLTALWTAVLVLGAVSLAMALAAFLLMEFRYQRQLARESSRLMLVDLLAPGWDREALHDLWAVSRGANREILEEVVVARREVLEGEAAREFERALADSGMVEHWLERLRRGGVKQRVQAATRLGLVRDSRNVEALVGATWDESPEVVLAAAVSLGRLGDRRGLAGLLELTRKPTQVIPDITLAAALAACARESPGLLLDLLREKQTRARVIGVWALSEVANETVLPELLAAASDSEPEVRAKVARALGRIPAPASLEPLIHLAHDPVWFVRVRALDALGRLGAAEGEAVALDALTDPVREVRYRAAFTLRYVGGMKSEVVRRVAEGGSRASFECLISEWERAGFLAEAVDHLALHDGAHFRESRELMRTLIAARVTNALVDFVRVHPNLKVRLRLVRLLAENPRPRVKRELWALAKRPGCDPRVAAAIRVKFPEAPPVSKPTA